MTSASRAVALVAVALLAASALAACAPHPAPRTAPNDAEVSAVIRASGFGGTGGRLDLSAPWVQLWTQRQLPAAISVCLQYGGDVEDCYAAHPVDTRVFAMSETQRLELYGYYATFLDRCLLARGIDPGRIPPRTDFLAGLADGTPWSPYDHVVVASRTAWYAVSDACPPVPDAIDRELMPR